MKTWLAKFRISCELDADNSAQMPSQSRDGEPEAVKRFAESARLLHCRLKSNPPFQPVPPGLHAFVMRSVRGATEAPDRHCATKVLRWLPATALALLVAGGLWWAFSREEQSPPSLETARAALERSHELTQQAPAAVLDPLSKEMESLNRDFR